MIRVIEMLKEEGRIEGRIECKRDGAIEVVLIYLKSALGGLSDDYIEIISSLSYHKLICLAEHINEVSSYVDLNKFLK